MRKFVSPPLSSRLPYFQLSSYLHFLCVGFAASHLLLMSLDHLVAVFRSLREGGSGSLNTASLDDAVAGGLRHSSELLVELDLVSALLGSKLKHGLDHHVSGVAGQVLDIGGSQVLGLDRWQD